MIIWLIKLLVIFWVLSFICRKLRISGKVMTGIILFGAFAMFTLKTGGIIRLIVYTLIIMKYAFIR